MGVTLNTIYPVPYAVIRLIKMHFTVNILICLVFILKLKQTIINKNGIPNIGTPVNVFWVYTSLKTIVINAHIFFGAPQTKVN